MDRHPIRVNLQHYRCFHENKPSVLTLPVDKIVALTGINNAGKSTALRFFYELKNSLRGLTSSDSSTWISSGSYEASNSWSFSWNQVYGVNDTLELFPNRSATRPIRYELESTVAKATVEINYTHAGQTQRSQFTQKNMLARRSSARDSEKLNVVVRDELVSPLEKTLYIGPFRNIVNDPAGGGNYYDLWNGSSFVNQWSEYKAGIDTLAAEQSMKIETVLCDLLGYDSLQIDASSDRKTLLVTVNKRRFNLSELGAGIAQLIICLINVAVKSPSWVLIDEPELHLHPAMQARFVEALALFASHGVVFSTHSIGLARTVADEIYVVTQPSPNASVITPIENVKSFAELLGELSFSQYEAVGFNRILLCEGVTEVRFFHQLLAKFGAQNKVLVVPLGGNAMIDPARQQELAEFNRFGVEVFVVIDSESEAAERLSPKRTSFIEVCNQLFGDGHAMQTQLRATENYLPEHAIQAATRSNKYRALQPYEDFNTLNPRWSKNENWKIAEATSKADWEETDIGQMLSRLGA